MQESISVSSGGLDHDLRTHHSHAAKHTAVSLDLLLGSGRLARVVAQLDGRAPSTVISLQTRLIGFEVVFATRVAVTEVVGQQTFPSRR